MRSFCYTITFDQIGWGITHRALVRGSWKHLCQSQACLTLSFINILSNSYIWRERFFIFIFSSLVLLSYFFTYDNFPNWFYVTNCKYMSYTLDITCLCFAIEVITTSNIVSGLNRLNCFSWFVKKFFVCLYWKDTPLPPHFWAACCSGIIPIGVLLSLLISIHVGLFPSGEVWDEHSSLKFEVHQKGSYWWLLRSWNILVFCPNMHHCLVNSIKVCIYLWSEPVIQ